MSVNVYLQVKYLKVIDGIIDGLNAAARVTEQKRSFVRRETTVPAHGGDSLVRRFRGESSPEKLESPDGNRQGFNRIQVGL